MATVTVLKFSTAEGAQEALREVKSLQSQHLIKLHDAAIVSWPIGESQPRTQQAVDLVSARMFGGMFWGALFGMIFAVPLVGLALGAAYGAVGGALGDIGIDDRFIQDVRGQVTEGTSALFLMTSEAVMDRVVDGMKDFQFEIIATNLSKEQEEKLLEVFGKK